MKLVRVGDKVFNLEHLVSTEKNNDTMTVVMVGNVFTLHAAEASQFNSALSRLLCEPVKAEAFAPGQSRDPETGLPIP